MAVLGWKISRTGVGCLCVSVLVFTAPCLGFWNLIEVFTEDVWNFTPLVSVEGIAVSGEECCALALVIAWAGRGAVGMVEVLLRECLQLDVTPDSTGTTVTEL